MRLVDRECQRLRRDQPVVVCYQAVDDGEIKDPASPRVAAYRATSLGAAKRNDEANVAFHVAVAIEIARLKVAAVEATPSGKSVLRADDIGRLVALYTAWSRIGGNAQSVLGRNLTLIGLIDRVPASDWDRELSVAALPTVFDRNKDKRRIGITLRQFSVGARMAAAKQLLDLGRLEEAATHANACREAGNKLMHKPGVDPLMYEIYRKMGRDRAAKFYTKDVMDFYAMQDKERERLAERNAILERGEKINNEFEAKAQPLREQANELLKKRVELQDKYRSTADPAERQRLNQQILQIDREMNAVGQKLNELRRQRNQAFIPEFQR